MKFVDCPAGPWGPVAPVGPWGPVAPEGPAGPCGPAGPGVPTPLTSLKTIGWEKSGRAILRLPRLIRAEQIVVVDHPDQRHVADDAPVGLDTRHDGVPISDLDGLEAAAVHALRIVEGLAVDPIDVEDDRDGMVVVVRLLRDHLECSERFPAWAGWRRRIPIIKLWEIDLCGHALRDIGIRDEVVIRPPPIQPRLKEPRIVKFPDQDDLSADVVPPLEAEAIRE